MHPKSWSFLQLHCSRCYSQLQYSYYYVWNIYPTDESRLTTVPKPRSWEVTIIQLYPTIRQLYNYSKTKLKIKVPGNQPTSA